MNSFLIEEDNFEIENQKRYTEHLQLRYALMMINKIANIITIIILLFVAIVIYAKLSIS